ncbi:MAG TPA: hypothetical protein VFX98_14810 [Longimicrobiaceae bacterium]|nr:hypothetical protein [Longimicrobiaceae bacterium]
MSRTRRFRALALAAALAAPAAPAAAQSVLASSGLGYPLSPLDARARGLGGVSVGLGGPSLSLVNPAAAGWLPAPTFSVTYQPDFYASQADEVDTDGMTSRFPVIQAAFPIRRAALFLGYGSYLDQHWQVEQRDSIDIGGQRRSLVDRFASDGGIARFRAGAAYRVSGRLALGVAADLFTGAAQDTSIRAIEGFAPFISTASYRFTGVGFSAGAHWNPTDAVSLGAVVSGGGELTGELVEDSVEMRRSYASPLAAEAGASARVTQNTVVALSGRWAGWSAADEDLVLSGGARDVVSASAGVEYEGMALAGRTLPLRLGARYTQLPFRWEGRFGTDNEFPDETAVTAGVGARLAGGAALLDLGAERGWRGGSAAGFDESYWRLSLTLTLLAR